MSHSFIGNYLANIKLNRSTLAAVATVYEYKGMIAKYSAAAPERLEVLRQNSIIESADHSNRIEGVFVSRKRLKSIVTGTSKPNNRDEAEVSGYKLVLDHIHKSKEKILLTIENILGFHDQLMYFTPEIKGKWKDEHNVIMETLPDGRQTVRFEPVPPELVEQEMNDLIEGFNIAWQDERNNQLLLVAAFALDFLCIHPFADGNGRSVRLLTLLLLYHAGFQVGRYVSLERIIDETKEGYYETLGISDDDWHESKHNLEPWLLYLCNVMLEAYQELEKEIGEVSLPAPRAGLVMDTVLRLPSRFKAAEVIALCPDIPEQTVRNILSDLGKKGFIRSKGKGRGSYWEKAVKI